MVTLQVKVLVGVGEKAEIQISRRELHTYIHLDYAIAEIPYCIQKKKKKNLMPRWDIVSL